MAILRILSLNCFGPPLSFNKSLRFKLLAEQINNLNPDIVMLQEVIFHKDRLFLQKILAKNGWHTYSTQNGLLEAGGLVIISKKFLYDIQFEKFKFQGGILNFFFGDAILGKGYQTAKLKTPDGDINLINTHLMYLFNSGKIYYKNHHDQMQQLSAAVKKLNRENIILAGDFNIDNPKSDEMAVFKKELNLSDDAPPDSYTLDPENLNRKGKLISILSDGKPCRPDYLLVGKDIRVINEKQIFQEPISVNNRPIHISDHYGIFAQVELT